MNPGQKTEVGDQEEKVMRIDSAKDLEVYKKEYSLAMEINLIEALILPYESSGKLNSSFWARCKM